VTDINNATSSTALPLTVEIPCSDISVTGIDLPEEVTYDYVIGSGPLSLDYPALGFTA